MGLSLYWFSVFLGPSWSFSLSWVCWELAERIKSSAFHPFFLTPTSKTHAHTCTEPHKIPVKSGKKTEKKITNVFWSFLPPLIALGHFPLKVNDLKENKETKNTLKTKEKGRVLVRTWKTKFKNNSYSHIFLQTWCKHCPVEELLTPITWFLVLCSSSFPSIFSQTWIPVSDSWMQPCKLSPQEAYKKILELWPPLNLHLYFHIHIYS